MSICAFQTRVEDLRAGALDADYFAQCLSESRVRLGEFEAHFLPASLAAAELDPTLPCAWRAAWEPYVALRSVILSAA